MKTQRSALKARSRQASRPVPEPRVSNRTLIGYYRTLLARFGPSGWWPGGTAFEIAVGAILTQNTAWTNVEQAIANLKHAKLLAPRAILSVHAAQLESALRPSGYFRVKARRLSSFCEYLVSRYAGSMTQMARVPLKTLRPELLSVHGIGPETADDILLYACAKPVFVVDGYTRRIFARHGLVPHDVSYEHLRGFFEHRLPEDVDLFKDYHAQIVYAGKEYCRSFPRCDRCPLRKRLPKSGPILR